MRSFSPGILWILRGCFLLHPDCVCVGGVSVCVCVCACACACGPDVSLINENKIKIFSNFFTMHKMFITATIYFKSHRRSH